MRDKKEKEPHLKDQVPGFHEKAVPSFCSILHQYLFTKGKMSRSPELHESTNVSSSVTFTDGIAVLKEMVLYIR